MERNFKMTCSLVGDVTNENLKEVANVMVWNCGVLTYKDEETTALANLTNNGSEITLNIDFDGYRTSTILKSKRVSAKMGKEIADDVIMCVITDTLRKLVEAKEEQKKKDDREHYYFTDLYIHPSDLGKEIYDAKDKGQYPLVIGDLLESMCKYYHQLKDKNYDGFYNVDLQELQDLMLGYVQVATDFGLKLDDRVIAKCKEVIPLVENSKEE